MRNYKTAAFAALMTIALAGAAVAQQAPLPQNNPEAAANVKQSEQYSAALRNNPGFRKRREAIECGPIADPQLHQQCIASFEAYAAAPPSKHRSQ